MPNKPEIFDPIRTAMAEITTAPKVEPNASITPDLVFAPESHRAVLDLSRQLVVGNRGMGKSLWTHALINPEVRSQIAGTYSQPLLNSTRAIIGFNGSDKLSTVAPTPNAISRVLSAGFTEEDVWLAVIYRAVRAAQEAPESERFVDTLEALRQYPDLYEETLSAADAEFSHKNQTVLIIFDALDRLADDWKKIRSLTRSLLRRVLGLKSFRSMRSKIFMRPDQYADQELFQFPDGSKLKSEHVDLSWQPYELFGLLFFEIMRHKEGGDALKRLASHEGAAAALNISGQRNRPSHEEQKILVDALAGPYMGTDARRGRVYTWVPLHLSDARNACSPRTFLTAWTKAAQHQSAPNDKVVDHLGLIDGVRRASTVRLDELREDYPWIDRALKSLKDQFVPMERKDLLRIWKTSNVVSSIHQEAQNGHWLAPIGLNDPSDEPEALLEAMKSIAVMEERANGKINVPDIFRVEAGIKRKGGVAVPRRN